MKRDRTGAKGDARLRERAEKQIKESARVPKALPRDDILELIHELEVHQVELELQNEELRRSQSEIEVSRKKYFDLYDLAPIGYVTLDRNGINPGDQPYRRRVAGQGETVSHGQPFRALCPSVRPG